MHNFVGIFYEEKKDDAVEGEFGGLVARFRLMREQIGKLRFQSQKSWTASLTLVQNYLKSLGEVIP